MGLAKDQPECGPLTNPLDSSFSKTLALSKLRNYNIPAGENSAPCIVRGSLPQICIMRGIFSAPRTARNYCRCHAVGIFSATVWGFRFRAWQVLGSNRGPADPSAFLKLADNIHEQAHCRRHMSSYPKLAGWPGADPFGELRCAFAGNSRAAWLGWPVQEPVRRDLGHRFCVRVKSRDKSCKVRAKGTSCKRTIAPSTLVRRRFASG